MKGGVQTTDSDAKNMIPPYMINLLVYFYLKTSKLKINFNFYDKKTTKWLVNF